MKWFCGMRKITLLILVVCIVFSMTGCFAGLHARNVEFQQELKKQSIENLDEKALTMQSGMKLSAMSIPLVLSDDNQAIFANFTDENSFQDYYDWYSNPQMIKEDFYAFCTYLCKEYEEQKGEKLTNVYLSIDMKMVYDYNNDALYLSNMYEKELVALEKFQVKSVQELTFSEEAREYLVENGFSEGINKFIDAPTTDVFFTNCPSVSIYNGTLMTDYSKALKY